MPLTYAIADLHGRYDLLLKAFDAIATHAQDRPHKIVTLGDYVDRGPKSGRLLQHLMDEQAAGRSLICLQGNHEQIMLLSCRKLPHPGWWIQNGGGATLLSYGCAEEGEVDLSRVPKEHLDWVAALPLMHIDQHRIYVHAGVNPDVPLDQQEALTDVHGNQHIVWKLYPDDDVRGHGSRHVVHGHHQHKHGPIKLAGRTNLDTLAWYTGRLVIGVFDDEKAGGPLDLIEVVCEPHEKKKAA